MFLLYAGIASLWSCRYIWSYSDRLFVCSQCYCHIPTAPIVAHFKWHRLSLDAGAFLKAQSLRRFSLIVPVAPKPNLIGLLSWLVDEKKLLWNDYMDHQQPTVAAKQMYHRLLWKNLCLYVASQHADIQLKKPRSWICSQIWWACLWWTFWQNVCQDTKAKIWKHLFTSTEILVKD